MTWPWVVLFAAGTYATKVCGPLLLGLREPLPRLERILEILPAALLGALITGQTIGTDGGFPRVTRVVAVLSTALLVVVWRRAPFIVTLVVASGLAAALRHTAT